MGLLGKFKNMFIEEIEEDDEPIKKEVIQVEIPAPKEKTEEAFEPVTKVEPEKKEEKFVFPVYFDDKDFEEIEKKEKTEPIVTPKREAYGVKKEEKTEKKIFKPTPIISPVYGVLDKNYSKEDITSKKRTVKIDYRNPNDKVDIDDVRKKAYGTLEDDLEDNLFEKTSILFNDEIDKQEIDSIEPRHEKKDETDLEEHEFEMQDDFVDIASDNMIEDELNKGYEEELKESSYFDELNDSDLFNLIDSMYERRDN